MTQSDVLRPHGAEYDSFLRQYVGEDGNGIQVTVLSALARLGVDPWKEASELAALPETAARARLDATIAQFPNVPSVELQHGALAQRLIRLLPRQPSNKIAAGSRNFSSKQSAAFGVPIIVTFATIMFIGQLLFFCSSN